MKYGLLVLVVVLSAACSGNGGSSADAIPSMADAEPPPTWQNFGDGFFMAYCYDCHGPGDTMRDYSLLLDVREELDTIRCGVSPTQLAGCTTAARMFPAGNGAMPSDAERERLVRWIDEGALD